MLSGIWAAIKALATALGLIQRAKDEKAGADAMAIKTDEQTIEAQKRMEDARNKDPNTAANTIDELQHGKF